MNKQQQRDEILKKRFKQNDKRLDGNTINKQTFLLFIGRRCRGWWLIYFFLTQNCQQRDLWRSRSSTAINVAKFSTRKTTETSGAHSDTQIVPIVSSKIHVILDSRQSLVLQIDQRTTS
jgi:hypothetical protein